MITKTDRKAEGPLAGLAAHPWDDDDLVPVTRDDGSILVYRYDACNGVEFFFSVWQGVAYDLDDMPQGTSDWDYVACVEGSAMPINQFLHSDIDSRITNETRNDREEMIEKMQTEWRAECGDAVYEEPYDPRDADRAFLKGGKL